MRKVTIRAEYAGTINTGNYENERPCYSVEETIEANLSLSEIEERRFQLDLICKRGYDHHVKRIGLELYKKANPNFRYYDYYGSPYPSVTSILNYGKTFSVSNHDLQLYAARGTLIHKQVEFYIEQGEWIELDQLDSAKAEYKLVTETKKEDGELIPLDNYNFRGFEEKYEMDFWKCETTVFNHEHCYAGTQDIKGEHEGKVTLFDIKTSGAIGQESKEQFFMQLAAYAKCEGNEDVEQLMVIHLNRNNKCGYANPIITDEIDYYFKLFLKKKKRGNK